jgi:DNA polymerase-3 subunit epsilon
MKLLFYDLETTGFGFERCAIIQLAGIMVDIGTDNSIKPLDAVNLKMRPRAGKMMDKRALEVNGYSIDEVLNWEDDHTAYEKFIKFISKYVDRYDKMDKLKLCGYNNSHFDSDFLRQWFVENGDRWFGSYFWTEQIDVMCEAARYLLNYRPIMNNFKLGNVADFLGIKLDEKSLHDGLYDVKVTLKVFKKILESGHLIMPFDSLKAEELFNQQRLTKDKYKSKPTSYTEEDAWVIA